MNYINVIGDKLRAQKKAERESLLAGIGLAIMAAIAIAFLWI